MTPGEKTEIPLITPEAIQVRHFPGEFVHNAIWDVLAGPDGRVYVSLCAEGNFFGSARLFAFDIDQDKLVHLFNVEKVTHAPPRAIPQSKIHTSMAAMEDGRMIMCTHMSASAPGQPFWTPAQSYEDPWEGYPGSHMLIYDPKTNHVEDMGIPVPRETTYGGGCYVPQVRQYFMYGMMKSLLYCFDVDSGVTETIGQAGGGIRLFHDRNGMVYGISRGWMHRFDPFKRELVDLLPIQNNNRCLGFVDEGPDGLIYIVNLGSQTVLQFDPYSGNGGKIREMGILMPDTSQFKATDEDRGPSWINGLAFGPDNKLYCGLGGGTDTSGMMLMFRWDILGGGKSECLGLLAPEGRPNFWIAEMVKGRDGRLYLADGNYYLDKPRFLILDTKKVKLPDESSPRVPRPPVEETLPLDLNIRQIIARSGMRNIPTEKKATIPLTWAVLPTGESDVAGFAVDESGLVHISAMGARGSLLTWDRNPDHLPAVAHRDENAFGEMATDGKTIFVLGGEGGLSLIAYDAKQAAAGKVTLRTVATFAEDAAPTGLKLDKASGKLFGLCGLENRIFTCDTGSGELKMGPATGNLVKGKKTLVADKDGCLYGVLDEGWIFRYDPKANAVEKLEARVPGLHGREYAARLESGVVTEDGTIFGGTGDGYVFRFHPATGKVENLGKPALSFGMPAMAIGRDGIIYGLTGTFDDFQHLFRYTDREGLTDLGSTVWKATSLAAVEGGMLVGGADRINDLVLYRF